MRSVDEVRERLSKVEGSMPEFVLVEFIFGGVYPGGVYPGGARRTLIAQVFRRHERFYEVLSPRDRFGQG